MDTLHPVTEDVCQNAGEITGITALKSWDRRGFAYKDKEEPATAISSKSGTRFTRVMIKILKDWVDEHKDHPYPSEEDKEGLMIKTGLTATQVTNWLANHRRRSKNKMTRASSPMSKPSAAIDIPVGAHNRAWDDVRITDFTLATHADLRFPAQPA